MKSIELPRAAKLSGKKSWGSAIGGALSIALLASASSAHAGAELKLGDNAGVNLGIGLRTSYTSAEKGAPNGTSRGNDFNVDNLRLYLSGHYGNVIKATFNTEKTGGSAASGGDNIRVMDAIAQFEFMPEFNIWLGRMLPPSDRANLYGPFFALPWSYPGVASNYPNLAVGRDNGAMVWGKPFNGKVVYSIGAFEGHNKAATLSGASDKLLWAGRLAFNILDPEPAPAHYTGGWYGGSKDILTVAVAGFNQQDGVGTVTTPGSMKIWSTDVLFEKKFGSVVPTLEGAYYKYKLGSVDCGSGEPGSVPCVGAAGVDNVGGQVDGKSYLVSAALLFTDKIGWGQFQPYIRYQQFDRSLSNTKSKMTDFGVNYIIKGPNAKISAVYTKMEDDRLPVFFRERDMFTLGVQLQY